MALRRRLSGHSSSPPAELDGVAEEVHRRLLRYSDRTLAESPQSYLFGIATNVVNERHSRAENDGSQAGAWLRALESEPQGDAEPSIEHTLASELRIAVGKLPPQQREVLLLHIHENLTYNEIATKLQLSPRIVRRDIARAYAQLRRDLHGAELDAISLT